MRADRRKLLTAVGTLGALGTVAPWAWSAAKIKPGEDSVLIVVDVQNCFVEGGTLPVAKGSEVVPIINRISKAFDNIVVTQDWHTQGHASFASAYSGKKPFETTKLTYGTQVLWPDLSLPTAQLIIRKGYHPKVDSYSAFMEADKKTATGLSGYLKQRGIKKVFVTGLATDFCVAWTAMDARAAGFEVAVVEDACRGIDLNGSLAAAWKSMADKGVKRIQSDDIQVG
jgi:nicotinamidase/pyrazinamidase